MKSNRLLPFLGLVLLLLGHASAQAQVVRYRDADSPRLWTTTEVDTIVQEMNRRYKRAGVAFQVRIKNTITRPDTLIHEYILSGTPTPAAKAARHQQLQELVGKPLPAFALPDLQGQTVSTNRLLGKPVVVNLWFTTCGPCVAEMPALNRIRREKAASEIVFLALTFDKKEKVQVFLQKRAFAFRHVAGAQRYCDQFTAGYPITLFVDRTGVVRSVLGSLPATYDPVTHKALGVDDREFYAALKQIE